MEIRRQQGLLRCLLVIFSLVTTIEAVPSQLESRIINGTEVNWNDTRYQVSVRIELIDRFFFGIGHICGGSLIAPNVVLTAAHCVWSENTEKYRSPQEFSVVMGNLDRTRKDANMLKLPVKDIIVGGNFDPDTFEDDIAIMILNQTVPSNYTRASTIELNENRNLIEGTKCIVSGWGLTEKGTYATKLRSVEVPIVGRSTCSRHYGTDILLNGMLCAGYMYGERDSCSADSGGPLVCNDKLVGIVSFGVGCAMPGFPGVYTEVAHYIDWISNKTGLKLHRGTDFPIHDKYYYNSTGSTNSTHGSNSSSTIFERCFIYVLLSLLSILCNLM
ncbi:trypsin-1-like [Musca autumnalis]|uniref:trypsin-1-like n=1 Tax=Musca autumnalis TaxID=221902 RepID=UPI003CE9105C